MTEETIYELYRLLAIAKYEDRYVIPKAHAEAGRELEELGLLAGLRRADPGSSRLRSVRRGLRPADAGGRGELPRPQGSGRPPRPIVPTEDAAARVNLLNWDGAVPLGMPGIRRPTTRCSHDRPDEDRRSRGLRVPRAPAATAPAEVAGRRLRVRGLSERDIAATRLACSWLLAYPDDVLLERLDGLAAAVAELPEPVRAPLEEFLAHLDGTPIGDVQRHYVEIFDMKRQACPYLTYWTNGDTRNRGVAILRFKQAYVEAGVHDRHRGAARPPRGGPGVRRRRRPGHRRRPARRARRRRSGCCARPCTTSDSAYVPRAGRRRGDAAARSPREVAARMAELAASGPPVEDVGLEPFPTSAHLRQEPADDHHPRSCCGTSCPT